MALPTEQEPPAVLRPALAALTLSAAILAPGLALAERWVPFYMAPEGLAYIDKDSIIRRPGHVSARLQSTFPSPQGLQRNGRVYSYVKTTDTIDVDCEAAVYRFVARDLYTDDGVKVLSIADLDDIARVIPGSPQEALGKAYCAKGYKPIR